MKVKFFMCLLGLLVLPVLLFGGTTGKIKGKVVDKQTNEVLVGASIFVEGTSYGAATDVNGEYVILNVPAGTYALKTTFVGYGAIRASNVIVNADLTTEQNFQLNNESIQLQQVEIVAQRPLVNKSSTNATRIIDQSQLEGLPVRGVRAVVALQAGVVEQGGQFFIRGGRQDEVGYYIDGADARNVVNGSQAVTIIPEAVEEFQVQAGGYNAEFGGANAGIIRQQLRSGGPKYTASLRAETDNFVDRGKPLLGGFGYGYSDYAATFGGPLVSDHIKFFLAGENTFQADPTVAFWDGFSFPGLLEDASSQLNPHNPIVTDPSSPYFGLHAPDTVNLAVPNGNVPGRGLQSWSGNGTLTLDYNPLIVRLSGSVNYSKQLLNPVPVRQIFNQIRIPNRDLSSGLYSAKVTYFPQTQTFIEATFAYQDQRRKDYDPVFGDDYLSYGDSIAASAAGLPTYFRRDQSPQDLRTNGFPFARPGSLNTGVAGATTQYVKEKRNYMSGAVDVTHQLEKHEIKAGVEYQRFTIRRFTFSSTESFLTTILSNPDVYRNGGAALDALYRSQGLPDNYGFDVKGNEINSGFDGPKHPTYYSAYAQDKFEVNDLVINFGIRFDSFDNDDFEFLNALAPGFDPTNFTIDPATTQKKKAVQTVSPRLGFSFPVTDRTVFHVQYGKFVQAPQLAAILQGTSRFALDFSGRNFIPVPVGTGLDPVRTTQYEIGFSQQITDFASFDLTTFYKDITGQIQAVKIVTTSGSAAASYNALQNGDFATTKGLEFTMTLRRINRLQGSLNYTLSDSRGTGSSLTTSISSVEQATVTPTTITPLAFDQAHRGTINLDYRFGKDDGGPVLERLGANVLFSFNSGHAYTKALASSSGGQRGPEEGAFLGDDDPRSRKPEGALNANTTPWVFTIDMRLDKTISIGDLFDVNLYIYVQNLLNTKNVLNVYSRTGSADDDGFLTNPSLSSAIVAGLGQTYVDMYKAINLKDRQYTYWQDQLGPARPLNGGDLYGNPRQIRFGIAVNY